MKKLFPVFILCSVLSCSQRKIHYDCNFENIQRKGWNYAIVKKDGPETRLDYYNGHKVLIKTQHYLKGKSYVDSNLNGKQIIYNYDGSIYSETDFKSGKEAAYNIKPNDAYHGVIPQELFNTAITNTPLIESYTIENKYTISRYSYGGNNKGWDSIITVVEFTEKSKSRLVEFKDYDKQDSIAGIGLQQLVQTIPSTNYQLWKFIHENKVFPLQAKEEQLCGTVKVRFIVEVNGSVHSVQIIGPSQQKALETEAMNVIKKTPLWIPGTHKGKPIRTICILPIEFTL